VNVFLKGLKFINFTGTAYRLICFKSILFVIFQNQNQNQNNSIKTKIIIKTNTKTTKTIIKNNTKTSTTISKPIPIPSKPFRNQYRKTKIGLDLVHALF